jgi:uncharacterized membrane protein
VAQGLAASGIAVTFAALLAGVNLYSLIPASLGFGFLALTTAAAVVLSLRHGTLVALLGLVGGFLTPLWVNPGLSRPGFLFGYLFLLQVGLLLVSRRRGWWVLALLTAVGSNLWAVSWVVRCGRPGSQGLPVGIFLLATVATFVAAARSGRSPDRLRSGIALPLAWGAAGSAVLLLASLVQVVSYQPAEWVLFGSLAAGTIVLGRLDPRYEGLPWLPATAGVLLLLMCSVRIVPDDAGPFAFTALALAALFIGGSYVSLWGARNPQLWAALCSTTGIGYLVTAWAGLRNVITDVPWGALSLVGALLFALLGVPVWKRRDILDRGENVLAALLVGATALVSLAAPLELKRAWIGVAWALEIPALAWIAGRLRVPALNKLAWLLGVVVAVRLLLNPFVLEYPIGDGVVLNWVLYGYGLPVLAFAVGSRWFRNSGDVVLGEALEFGSIALGFAMLALQVRHGFHPHDMAGSPFLFGELGTYTVAGLLCAIALWAAHQRFGLRSLRVGALCAGSIALVQALLTQVLASNPLWTPHAVGQIPLFNALLWSYGVPAALTAGLALCLARGGRILPARAATACSILFAFLFITLQVRQFFHGNLLTGGGTDPAEMYAYSVAWILFAAALLGGGLALRGRLLGYASALFMGLAVVKVFVVDTASLVGLFRVLSLLGLGLSLLALAYVYQRFVFRLIQSRRIV